MVKEENPTVGKRCFILLLIVYVMIRVGKVQYSDVICMEMMHTLKTEILVFNEVCDIYELSHILQNAIAKIEHSVQNFSVLYFLRKSSISNNPAVNILNTSATLQWAL